MRTVNPSDGYRPRVPSLAEQPLPFAERLAHERGVRESGLVAYAQLRGRLAARLVDVHLLAAGQQARRFLRHELAALVRARVVLASWAHGRGGLGR